METPVLRPPVEPDPFAPPPVEPFPDPGEPLPLNP